MEKKNCTLSLRLGESVRRDLEEAAEADGRKMSALVEQLIRRHLAERRQQRQQDQRQLAFSPVAA